VHLTEPAVVVTGPDRDRTLHPAYLGLPAAVGPSREYTFTKSAPSAFTCRTAARAEASSFTTRTCSRFGSHSVGSPSMIWLATTIRGPSSVPASIRSRQSYSIGSGAAISRTVVRPLAR
jgi:hypothetical protein